MIITSGWLAFVLALAAGCGPQGGDGAGVTPARAPRPLGSADGTGDAADHDCKVVLRSVSRIKSGPGYATTCSLGINSSGSCLYVWEGQIDVAATPAPASVELLFRTNQTGGQWYAVKAKPLVGASPNAGFARYTFLIADKTPAAGMSMTSLNKTVIDLIPYSTTTAGGRLFDHNRVSDPLGSYRLDLSNYWSVGQAPAVCAPQPSQQLPEYVLDFPGFGEKVVNGPLVAGGKLKVSYDGRRLRETQVCMGAKGPVSATTLHLAYMFDGNGGQVKRAQLEQVVVSSGYACQGPQPCVKQQTQAPVIDLPPGARSIQLWFYCVPGFSGGSPGNWKYDSNLGQNYKLQILGGGGKTIDWAGDWRLHASRSGFTFPLPVSHSYSGFTNMGWSVQAEVYVAGITDQQQVDAKQLRAFVESDLLTCAAGGALKKAELPLAATHAGSYNNNVLYRWGFEGLLFHCPKGSYRYRFLFSADGGQTFVPLGAGTSTSAAGAGGFRTIVYK